MQEFIVSNLEDENDGDFSAGDLSLREAIANAESGDTISLSSDLSGATINLSLGELKVEKNLSIQKLGVDNLTINANNNSRVFNLDDGSAETKIDVVIDGLNITGGNASSEELGTFGGGIFNQENLELNDSEIFDNTAVAGGGIYNLDATASINNSAILNNSIPGNNLVETRGGGIANLSSTVKIDNSSIENNSGSGIDALESEITIVDSSVSNNNDIGTGGIGAASTSTINLENSQVNNNSASVLGLSGGIFSSRDSTLNINNSTISENSGEGPGEGDPKSRQTDAAGINANGATNISNSTISNNRGIGFGIVNSGKLDIANSTFSGNEDTGIINRSGTAVLSSTIVANNGEVNTPDIVGGELSGDNNLIGNGDGIELSNSNLVGTAENPIDPLLGELQNNGGSTLTQALQEDSPAIDAGSNSNNLETDQRGEGFDRTVGDGTDIGAFEVQADDGGGDGSLVVSTLDDEEDGDFSEGDLSLREAIALANEQEGEDTITFDSSLNGGAIAFDETLERELSIDDSVSIIGLGQDNLTLDGGFIFTNQADADLAIDGLNLTGGKVDSFGNLTLTNSTISQTIALDGSSDNPSIIGRGTTNISDSSIVDSNGGGSLGVEIESGTANIDRSTIANHGEGVTGGAGVIIRTEETVNINNSTIANNSNTRGGGGLVVNGTVNVSNSTIVNNASGIASGGIIVSDDDVVNLTSSIVANNTGANIGPVEEDVNGEIVSGGNNLIGNGDEGSGFVESDIVGTLDNPIEPQLAELQDNGGTTETLALLDGSPAIDAGSNPNNLETDQRGEGFDRTVGNGTDIGAFEVQADDGGGQTPIDLIVSTSEDENDGDFSAGDLSLREAISLANEQEGEDTITFSSELSDSTIVFDESLERNLAIDDSVSIIGLGQDNLTLDGGFIFTNEADADLAIDGLNLVGSKIDSSGNLTFSQSTISQTINFEDNSADSSAIISRGTAIISDSNIIDNSSNFAGNTGIFIESGTATIERSTIAENRARSLSGISIGSDATVDLINSTVANNSGRSIGGIGNDGSLNVINSTVAGNLASSNGGDRIGQINNAGNTELTSSIVTSNDSDSISPDISGDGELVSNGNNLVSNGDNISNFVDSDIVGTADNSIDPQLGELQDNGGATKTFALLEDSPAIDAGSNPNDLATDQRGTGFDRTVGNGTDIGAFEVQAGIIDPGDIIGTDEDDFLTGTEESDRIEGLAGNDFLRGLGGDDTLQGDDGNDTLLGGEGNDFIDGGKGDDFLRGDAGNDTFVLAPGKGKDFVVGFERGHDSIALPTGISFDDLSFDNRNLILGDETLATFTGFDPSHLTESDFVHI